MLNIKSYLLPNKKLFFSTLIYFVATTNLLFAQSKLNLTEAIEIASQHYKNALLQNNDPTKIPRSTNMDGSLKTVNSSDWCSGFFAGSLWLLKDLTKDIFWKSNAEKWTQALQKEQYNKTTHDLGFMMYNSFGNGFLQTSNPKYKEIIVESAKSIASRFNPKVGLMRSWDKSVWQYPVIIDNMMNLELLFEASKLTGDKTYEGIAIKHADKDMLHHFRPDFSSYHLLDFDTISGVVIKKQTHQGYNDASAWARGQAWGLYGFTMMYRYTKDVRYLKQAQGIASFILKNPNWPDDNVPYWDFNVPEIPKTYKDASAGAIIASALLELSTYSETKTANFYRNKAEAILISLSSPTYTASIKTNNNFILMHSVGNLPAGYEIDSPINYADYYYLEALNRFKKLIKQN